MKRRRKEKFTEPGLTDRSERPTSHEGFAPLEREKEREERIKRRKFRMEH